jgi:hypothetical protein
MSPLPEGRMGGLLPGGSIPWTNAKSGGPGGFIALVLQHDQFVTLRLVIGCKLG